MSCVFILRKLIAKVEAGQWQFTNGQDLAGQVAEKAKLARSAGASPAQIRLSKPPGSECCVRRRRAEHEAYTAVCGNEPRNDELAGTEIVFMIERNMSMPLCEALSSRRGRGPYHAQIDRVGTWDISGPTAGSVLS